MNLKNLSLITKHTAAIAALLVGISGVARADDITYKFTGDPNAPLFPDSEFDGSTITLTDPANPTLLSWDIKAGGNDFTGGNAVWNITSYDLTGFNGSFAIQDGSLFGGEGVIGADGPPGLLNPDGGYLLGVVDPIGWWTEVSDVSTTGRVPDSGSTMGLLSGVLSVMAGVRYSIRRK